MKSEQGAPVVDGIVHSPGAALHINMLRFERHRQAIAGIAVQKSRSSILVLNSLLFSSHKRTLLVRRQDA